MMVLEVAALLKVEIPTENNKLITPKLTLEVIPSSLNSPDAHGRNRLPGLRRGMTAGAAPLFAWGGAAPVSPHHY